MDEPKFLTIDEVILLHEISLDEHLFGIAAAYAYHIAEAQAFLDGNKRTAMSSALAFLELNGISTTTNTFVRYDGMIAIATHDLDKSGRAALLRQLFGQ